MDLWFLSPEKHKPDSHRFNISGIWDKNSLLGHCESALFSFTFWGPCLVLPSFLYDGICGAGARGTRAWRVMGRQMMVIPVSVIGCPGGDSMGDEDKNMSFPSSEPGTNKSGLEEGEVGEKRKEMGMEEDRIWEGGRRRGRRRAGRKP